MNRFQKKIMIIAAAICNVSLTLTAAAVATYAWYVTSSEINIDVVSNSAEITAEKPNDIDFHIYKYDDDLKAGVDKGNSLSQLTLPDYDQYITEKNEYANVIIRATMNIAFDPSKYDLCIDISRAQSDYRSGGHVQAYTSNVVQFKAAVSFIVSLSFLSK